jgi:hypothetical protein
MRKWGCVGVGESSNIFVLPHLEGRTALRNNTLSTRTVCWHISHCCLHRANLSSYFSKNCSNYTHCTMILKSSYKIRQPSNMFRWWPPPPSSRKYINCWSHCRSH